MGPELSNLSFYLFGSLSHLLSPVFLSTPYCFSEVTESTKALRTSKHPFPNIDPISDTFYVFWYFKKLNDLSNFGAPSLKS
jgi:hypothetical protein